AIAALWAIPFVAMAGAGWWFCRGVPRPGSAWVTTPEPVELKAAPFEEAGNTGRLRPAQWAEIAGSDGGWIFVRAGTEIEGWVQGEKLERVMTWLRPGRE
ncbi:MAG TPA: hypothetical protein VMN36_10230, partial [Verrucomicrobiales bacterium]|nr:hypothetical protein [Verrucomicrobiales bacterium]